MPSDTGIDGPALTLDDMCAKINDNLWPLRDDDSDDDCDLEEYIPETVLEKLINPTAVKNVLQYSSIHCGLQLHTPVSELAQWFGKDAFKLFAILAKNNQLRVVEQLYHERIRDEMLPVQFKWLNKRQTRWEIKPCRKTREGDEDEDDDNDEDDRKRVDDEQKVRQAFRCGGNSLWGMNPEGSVYLFYKIWQWRFVPPVFVKSRFRYEFDADVHLPFTRSGTQNVSPNSLYSHVQEYSVHVDHLPKDLGIPLDDQGNPRVAIKQLKQLGGDFESVANGEAKVLERMRKINSKHLIKAIAYYRQGKDHCFMFPWAEMRNLWYFWTNNTPKTERETIIWIFTQLVGLTSAIEKLHHGDKALGLDSNCRHGDLKPENILCFRTKDSKTNLPRLVITDVGLAREHNEATELRKITAESVTTKRYAPPELTIDPNTPKSRRFDVWSLGCIFLEFVIWILYPTEKLKEFSQLVGPFCEFTTVEVGSQSYLSPTPRKKTFQTASDHHEVKDWISYMKDDWRCAEGTALRCLLDLIDTRMLVIPLLNSQLPSTGSNKLNPATRKQTMDLNSLIDPRTTTTDPQSGKIATTSISAKQGTVIAEPDSVHRTPGLTVTEISTADHGVAPGLKHRNTSDFLASTDGLSRDPSLRAYAPEVREELERVLFLLRAGPDEGIKAIGDKPPGEGPGSPPGPLTEGKIQTSADLELPESTQRQNYLNDDWDYSSDETIAKIVFSSPESSPPLLEQVQFSMLCPRCKELRLWSLDCSFTDSVKELMKKAKKYGCALCKLLFKALGTQSRSQEEFVRFARVSSYLTIDKGLGQAVANIYTTSESEWASLQSIQLGSPKIYDAGSAVHLRILKEWVRSCDSAHQCYSNRAGFLPTRLLDVGDSVSRDVRLHECARDNTGSEAYIALSHRWGSPQQHAAFCTYRSNIETFRRGIDASQLPKTFQDAVKITRSLGLRFLWIDSLCIIQDDQEDWARESKFMERIYSSAYCTIAASCASGTSDGFLKARPERRYLTLRDSIRDEAYYVCEVIDDFHRDVDQSELNQRGWVLQERALSRRTIFFTETQSYWECGEGVRCETMTKMRNRKASFLGDANFPRSAEKYVKGMRIKLLQDLYERYSRLKLSYPSDRPIAIKGLETRLIDTFETSGGFGVLHKYLHRCLLWQRAGSTLKRIRSFRRGIEVPSWSWMSYDGPIRYMPVPFGQVSWNVKLASPFVESRHSLLQSGSEYDAAQMLELEVPISKLADMQGGQIIFDEQDDGLPDQLMCVIVGESKAESSNGQRTCYILLVRLGSAFGEDPVYERVGVGMVEQRQIASGGLDRKVKIR